MSIIRKVLQVNMQEFISIETSESYISADYDYTGEIDLLLKEGMQSVAHQLCELPNLSNEQSDEYYRILLSPYLGAGSLPYGIAGVSLGLNFSKRSQLLLAFQIRGNESTHPYSQSDYNVINIGFKKYFGKKLNKYLSLGFGPSLLEYTSESSDYSFEQDGGDMFIEFGTILKRNTYFNPNISIRIGYSNIGGITTEDDSKYSLEGGYFMILGHIDLIKI